MVKYRYVMQWDEQPVHLCKGLCSLMETQTLVDLTIICNTYSIKVHKCVLAANSIYFREHLERDLSIDRVVINGLKHPVVKALIEFIYCGEATVSDEHVQELVSAAKYFSIRGITSIIPEKLDIEIVEEQSFNLLNKPPVFYSKNDKAKYFYKENENNYTDNNSIKIMLGDNFDAYENSNRNRKSATKVTAEAHVALAKEEAASRFALEMLKKDINNTANVFVIDETCTEATVETNLTAQYPNSDSMMEIQEYVIDGHISDIKNIPNLQKTIPVSEGIGVNNLLKEVEMEQIASETTNCSQRIGETYNVNFPVLYKATDAGHSQYVNVSNQVLEDLSNNHTVAYQMVPEENNVGFQQYICNNFGNYTVEVDNSNSQPRQQSIVDYRVLKQENSSVRKEQLTFTQLVADTVTPEYNTYAENAMLVENVRAADTLNNILVNKDPITYENSLSKIPDKNFVSEQSGTYNADSFNENQDKDVVIMSIVPVKRKRGRPPKRKLWQKNEFILNERHTLMENKNLLPKIEPNEDVEVNPTESDEKIILTAIVKKDEENQKEDLNSESLNVSPTNDKRRQTRSTMK